MMISSTVLSVLLAGGGLTTPGGVTPFDDQFPTNPQEYAEAVLSFIDAHGYYANTPLWATVRANTVASVATAKTRSETHGALHRAVKVAGGKHSSVRSSAPAATSPATHTDPLPTVTTAHGITTIVVPEFGGREEQAKRFEAIISDGIDKAAAQTTGWIVDLRENGGGNYLPMVGGLQRLIPDGVLTELENRDGARTTIALAEGVISYMGYPVRQVPNKPKINAPLAVLQNHVTASSGELTLIALRHNPRHRTFGINTAGYASANLEQDVADGASLVLTNSMYVDHTGKVYQEDPVLPDQRTSGAETVPSATAWLRAQPSSR